MNGPSQSEVTAEKMPDGSLSIRGPRGAAIVVNGRMNDVFRLQFGGHLVGKMMALTLEARRRGRQSSRSSSTPNRSPDTSRRFAP